MADAQVSLGDPKTYHNFVVDDPHLVRTKREREGEDFVDGSEHIILSQDVDQDHDIKKAKLDDIGDLDDDSLLDDLKPSPLGTFNKEPQSPSRIEIHIPTHTINTITITHHHSHTSHTSIHTIIHYPLLST
jgi:hypothetical protein